MEQSRSNGFCCGGGGGMSFIDEPPDQRVNQERARQVLETDADVVAVGCPFCMTMLEDGINARKGDRDTQGHGRGRTVVASGRSRRPHSGKP